MAVPFMSSLHRERKVVPGALTPTSMERLRVTVSKTTACDCSHQTVDYASHASPHTTGPRNSVCHSSRSHHPQRRGLGHHLLPSEYHHLGTECHSHLESLPTTLEAHWCPPPCSGAPKARLTNTSLQGTTYTGGTSSIEAMRARCTRVCNRMVTPDIVTS